MKKLFNIAWRDAAAVLFFVGIVALYFFTPVIKGQTLQTDDHVGGIGAGQERIEYNNTHDDVTYWTNSLFGGMPTYQIAPSYPSSNLLFTIQKVLGLGLPQVMTYVFLMLLGFYIMLRAFDFRQWMAALGAVLWAFSSYFFIIIWAGHLWKVYALAYLPALIGGIVLCLRGRLVWGALVTALFTALEVVSNHVQMTYYFMPVVAVVMGCVAWQEYKALKAERSLDIAKQAKAEGDTKKTMHTKAGQTIARRCAVAIGAAIVGVCINLTNLYHTYEYSRETMRGGSELTQGEGGETNSGLSSEYITQWSYGIDETWSLLVPNINGGSSMETMNTSSAAMSKADPMYQPLYQYFTQYFGDQPMTNGPVYVGIIVVLLAILGLVLCRGPLKWGLLALTLLSIMLAWGHNFMGLTEFFIDNVPLYNKFRTVSSILVVAEFCIPLLAVMGLKEFIERLHAMPHDKKVLKPLLIAGGALTQLLALMALSPSTFVTRFVSNGEMAMLNYNFGSEPNVVSGIVANLTEMRQAMVSADAWRSLAFMLFGGVPLLLLYYYRRIKWQLLVGLLSVACLLDMWSVDKRYLNDGRFHTPTNIEQTFSPTAADRTIMQDTALDYRVLNLSGNAFNENQTSYHHKSVGGYHAAKLQRYQDLISYHLQPQMQAAFDAIYNDAVDSLNNTYDVINMLNTRWFILPLTDSQPLAIPNPYAFGNAWFVDAIYPAATAGDELAALGAVDLRTTAVISNSDLAQLGTVTSSANRQITLRSYEPNCLVYNIEGEGGLAVLSEIYYPGWTATLDDDSELPIVRANYVLRAVQLPSGQHTLTLRFDPQSIHTTEGIAWGAWALLGLLAVLLLFKLRRRI